jgi:hypothetical protein
MCNKKNNYQKPAMKVVRMLHSRHLQSGSPQTDPVGARESRDGSWDDKE